MGYDDDTRVLEQFLPINALSTEEDIISKYNIKGLPVKGVAVSNKTNLFGIRWVDQAIQQYAKTLKGREIVLNHEHDNVEKVIGIIHDTAYDQSAGMLNYIGDINKQHPSGIAHSIEQGYVKYTSVRSLLRDFRCSICGEQVGHCTHRINQTYKGEKCEGLVYQAEAIHLGTVVKGADPNATVEAVAQSANETWEALNESRVRVLVQSINDSKMKKLLEQQHTERINLSTEEEKLQQRIAEQQKVIKELEDFKKTVGPMLEQMKESQKLLAEENARFKAQKEQEMAEKKALIIDQICKITGEEPATYADRELVSLEDSLRHLKGFEEQFKTKKQEEVTNQSAGQFQAATPKKPSKEELNEMVIKGIGRIFNLHWVSRYREAPIEKDRNDLCRILTQSAFEGVDE